MAVSIYAEVERRGRADLAIGLVGLLRREPLPAEPALLQKHLEVLIGCGEAARARAALVEGARDCGSLWKQRLLARAILAETETQAAAEAMADGIMAGRPELAAEMRLLLLHLAPHVRGRTVSLDASRYKELYLLAGRPEWLVAPCIEAPAKSGLHRGAIEEMERVIQAGYHVPWVFLALADEYRATGRSGAETLRALTCEVELFPRDQKPLETLKKDANQQRSAVKVVPRT